MRRDSLGDLPWAQAVCHGNDGQARAHRVYPDHTSKAGKEVANAVPALASLLTDIVLKETMKAWLVCVSVLVLWGVIALAQAPSRPARPLRLAEIQYQIGDRQTLASFFQEHFGARALPAPGNPDAVARVDLRAGESVIHLLRQAAGTRGSADTPGPGYGVYWLGLRTANLPQTLTRLEIGGVRVRERVLDLPHDVLTRAALIEGPGDSLIALVLRKDRRIANRRDPAPQWGDFGLDHLFLLVKSAKDNETFFREVFAGRVVKSRPHLTLMNVGGVTLVLAEPEVLGLRREQMHAPTEPSVRGGVLRLGFSSHDVTKAIATAKRRGDRLLQPAADTASVASSTDSAAAVILSPDGLPCALLQERAPGNDKTRR